MFQYRGTIVCDDCSLLSLYHFIHSFGSQTRSNCIRDAFISIFFHLGIEEEVLFAAVIFDRLTSIGFSLSWNLLPFPAVDVVAAMVRN
jgi:hypothetical protein